MTLKNIIKVLCKSYFAEAFTYQNGRARMAAPPVSISLPAHHIYYWWKFRAAISTAGTSDWSPTPKQVLLRRKEETAVAAVTVF